jgi:hypothetical protein
MMKKIIMSVMMVAVYAPLCGITITFRQEGDASQREHVIEIPAQQACAGACYTVDATDKELTLELKLTDVIKVSTYVEHPYYHWALQPVAKEFMVTQKMDKSVIMLDRDSYQILEEDTSKQ